MGTKIRLPHAFPFGSTPDGGQVTNDFLAVINSMITTRSIILPSFTSDESVAVGDGTLPVAIPEDMDGWYLTTILSAVSVPSTSGDVEIMTRCSREDGASRTDLDILEVAAPLKVLEDKCYGKIYTKFRVQTGDLIFTDIDSAGTGTLGLFTIFTFGK